MATQREFAKLRGVSDTTVQEWRRHGLLVFSPDGRLDVVASERLIDSRPGIFRGGKVKPKPAPSREPTTRSEPLSDPALADVPAAVLDEAAQWTFSEAARRKECALACLRQLEYEKESGAVVAIADVAREVASEYCVVRDRLLALPGKLADGLVGLDRRGIEARLRGDVYEALSELSEKGSRL